VVAGTVAGLLTARQLSMPMWTVADALTPALALGTVIGRIGCFLNGCCYGTPTQLPWGVVFPPDSFAGLEFGNATVHPSQLYFALAGLVLFAVVWLLRGRLRVPGTLFWVFLALFAMVRIPLDATRAYEPEASLILLPAFDIKESQVTSFALLLFSTLMVLRLRRLAAARA